MGNGKNCLTCICNGYRGQCGCVQCQAISQAMCACADAIYGGTISASRAGVAYVPRAVLCGWGGGQCCRVYRQCAHQVWLNLPLLPDRTFRERPEVSLASSEASTSCCQMPWQCDAHESAVGFLQLWVRNSLYDPERAQSMTQIVKLFSSLCALFGALLSAACPTKSIEARNGAWSRF